MMMITRMKNNIKLSFYRSEKTSKAGLKTTSLKPSINVLNPSIYMYPPGWDNFLM